MASPFVVSFSRQGDEYSVAATYTSQLSTVTSPILQEKLKEVRALMKSSTWGGYSSWNESDGWEKVLKPLLDLLEQEEEMSPSDSFEVRKVLADVYIMKSDLENARLTLENNLKLLSEYSDEIPSSCRKMAEVYKNLARVEILTCRKIRSEKGPLEDAIACLKRAWEHYQGGWNIPKTELAQERNKEGLEELKIHESLAINYVNFLLRCRESKEEEYKAFFSRHKEELPSPLKFCKQALKNHPKSPGLLFAKIQIDLAEERLFDAERACRNYLDNPKVDKIVDKVRVLDIVTDICKKIHQHVIAQCFCEEACGLDIQTASLIERTRKLLKMKWDNALPRDDGHILSAALNVKDRAYARKLFEEIMDRYFYPEGEYGGLSPSDQIEVFLGRAKIHVEDEEFTLASQCLSQAQELLQTEKSLKNIPRKWAIFHYCSARITQNVDEAIEHFEKGWEVSYPELVWYYLHFLFNKQLFPKALEICAKANAEGILSISEFYFWQAKIFSKQKKPATVKENCDELLRFAGTEEKLKLMKIEACDLAAVACKTLDYPAKEVYEYQRQAYELDDSPRCIERFQELKEIQKENSHDIAPPQEKASQELLDAAFALLKKEKFQEARQIFEHLEKMTDLSSQQLYNLHYGYARVFMQMQPPSLDQARSKLQQALEQDVNNEKKAEVYRRLAQTERNVEKAEENFEKGYELCPKQVALPYIEFLIDQFPKVEKPKMEKMHERALVVCKNFSKKSDRYFWKAKVEYAAKNLNEALKHCERAIEDGDIRATLELKAFILVGMERYEEAVRNISSAYHRFVRPENYRELSEKYLQIVGAQITDKHLQKLLHRVINTRELQKAHYVEALLREYEEELRVHKTCSINFFFLCAQLHVQEGRSIFLKEDEEKRGRQFDLAIRNYERVLNKINPHLRKINLKVQKSLKEVREGNSLPKLELLL